MPSLVVRSERVALPDAVRPAAVHVRDGRILRVAGYDERVAGVEEFDAGNFVVLPGLVDSHVHLNDPGRAHWEGVEHGTRAAAAGGVTTLVDMPLNSIPATTTLAGFEAKRHAIEGRVTVDVGLWGGVVPGNASELEPLARAGVLGFKCFLCPSGVEEFAHVSESDLRSAMPVLADLSLPLLAHAELPHRLLPPDAADPRSHETWLRTRPPEAENDAIDLLIRLSAEYGTRVHIVHLVSAGALPAIRAARARGLPLIVETCPHYLVFAAEDISDGATAFKCAPPIRSRSNREQLWHALRSGEIDLIATDHSPAPPDLKCIDEGDFLRAWGGIASVQLGLSAIWTAAQQRQIPIESVVRWMCEAPARLAGLGGRKGTIAAGADADLVVWDPDAESEVNPARLLHRHPVTPYAGMRLRGQVRTTYLRGEKIYDEGRIMPRAMGNLITR